MHKWEPLGAGEEGLIEKPSGAGKALTAGKHRDDSKGQNLLHGKEQQPEEIA